MGRLLKCISVVSFYFTLSPTLSFNSHINGSYFCNYFPWLFWQPHLYILFLVKLPALLIICACLKRNTNINKILIYFEKMDNVEKKLCIVVHPGVTIIPTSWYYPTLHKGLSWCERYYCSRNVITNQNIGKEKRNNVKFHPVGLSFQSLPNSGQDWRTGIAIA